MPYDEELARRLAKAVAGRGNVDEMRAFGGIMYMLDGKMCVGVEKDRLMVRVDPTKHESLLRRRGAGPMDFTGRPMRGFLFIRPEGVRGARALSFWVDESVSYVRTLPAKRKGTGKGKRKGGKGGKGAKRANLGKQGQRGKKSRASTPRPATGRRPTGPARRQGRR